MLHDVGSSAIPILSFLWIYNSFQFPLETLRACATQFAYASLPVKCLLCETGRAAKGRGRSRQLNRLLTVLNTGRRYRLHHSLFLHWYKNYDFLDWSCQDQVIFRTWVLVIDLHISDEAITQAWVGLNHSTKLPLPPDQVRVLD